MRKMLLGVAACALLPSPLFAQAAPDAAAILDRLNALEAKVARLEARNRELEAAAAAPTAPPAALPAPQEARLAKVERQVDALPRFKLGVAPLIESADKSFSFKPRGMIHLDWANYDQRRGGYDFNNGTDIRRGRFGFEGVFARDFAWRIDAEYVRNSVSILDAYLQYTAIPGVQITVGQHKTPQGLEPNTSDTANTFAERGMFTNAFGAVGAERREGVSIFYGEERFTAAIGVFGSGEAVTREPGTPDEAYGVNARVTFDPILQPGRILHVGASAFEVRALAENSVTVADRPSSRVDNGRIVSATVPDARLADYYAVEAVGVLGPASLQGEYGRLRIQRGGGLPAVEFAGFYLFGSLFLTGETRVVKGGVMERVRPRNDFSAGESLGAFELALRYDRLDLTDRGFSPLPRVATSWTGAVNWYLNPNLRLAVNYIRAKGTNSPLVADPPIDGTTAKVDVLQTRLQFDF
ncbi:porin [Sphingomonas sp. 1P06PA]|uniref:OprO/OprP family phosphate-selective porin n=1 Tax=Sphingomonas sp. 1P06PA TaxID=554121 RepID=UPI0039A45383